MICKYSILEDRAVLRVSGNDCQSFLQGLITANVAPRSSDNDSSIKFSALLSPQGKVLFEFFLIAFEDGYLIDISSESTEDFLNKLLFYRLRADVQISDISENMAVVAVWEGSASLENSELGFQDPRFSALGQRFILNSAGLERLKNHTGYVQFSSLDYYRNRVSLGIPEVGTDLESGRWFPHDLCLDLLNGIDFSKGCFTGQEVVSRMRHRGTARKRIILVLAQTPIEFDQRDIRTENSSIGTLFAKHDTIGAGVVRLDRAKEALENGDPVFCGLVRIEFSTPQWANYELSPDRSEIDPQ